MLGFGLLPLVIAVGFAVHAMKTGRPSWWMYIILFLPVVGSLAYVVIELLPELAHSRGARAVTSNINTIIDPHREWREKARDAELVDSVDAKIALGRECERKGMWGEAVRLYEASATGLFAQDALVLTSLARAHLEGGNAQAALDTLDKLRAANPDDDNQAAHLLYARALETKGSTDEALQEYEHVSSYYVGFEARTRYALLLLRQGHPLQAKKLFQDVIRAAAARPVFMGPGDKEWIKVAKSNLR